MKNIIKNKLSKSFKIFLAAILLLTQLSFTNAFAIDGVINMSLSATSGKSGDSFSVYLNNLQNGDYGYVYFDSNNSYTYDSGDSYSNITADDNGEAVGTLTVPSSISAGTYRIKYHSNSLDNYVYNYVTFTVNDSGSISVSPASGTVGSTATVTLSNLPSSDSGYVYFDKNNNGVWNSGEDSWYTYGSASKTITIPAVSAGTYNIVYHSYSIEVSDLSTSFTVNASATMSLSSTSGAAGSSVTVSLSNLSSTEDGYIYVDWDKDGTYDYGDGYWDTYASYGSVSKTITIPSVSAGTYNIRYSGSSGNITTSFTVKANPQILLSQASGTVGSSTTVTLSNLPSSDSGYVYFDENNNGVWNSGEDSWYTYGSASKTIMIPSVSAGTYNIVYHSYSIEVSDISASFTVKANPQISLSQASGTVGSSTTVTLSNLPSSDSGYVYFDENNNGVWNSGEDSWYTYGSASKTITIPAVSAGTYNIVYHSYSIEVSDISASFTVKANPQISLSSTSGKTGSSVAVSLSKLPSYDTGYIYFDINNDGSWNSGEDYWYTTASSYGYVSKTITIPTVIAGAYNIKYKSTSSLDITLKASFTVNATPTMSLSPTSGPAGGSVKVSLNNLSPYDSGYIYFDKNNNGSRSSGEDYWYVDANYAGSLSKTITIPKVSSATYGIRYNSTGNSGLSVSSYFTVKGISVNSISLDKKQLSLIEGGESIKLNAAISPSNASNKTVWWSSSDESVAIVEDGVVTPVGAGNAVITATSDDGSKTASCTVTVNAKNVAVEQITLDNSALSFTIGDEPVTLNATISPENATDKSVTWTSSNESVATVDSNGKVKAVGAGSAVITATSSNEAIYASCEVTVTAKLVEKTEYSLSELINDEDTFNEILGKFTADQLKVKIPVSTIQKIKISQNDTLKLSSFQVTVDAEKVDAVKIKANGKEYSTSYQGDGVYKAGIYNLPKGSEVIVNAYDGSTLVDSSVQRLRTLDYSAAIPDKTEYTLEELVSNLDLFNEILGSYTLDEIHVTVPTSYIDDVQIKYNSIATAIIAIVKNGANRVDFETKINGQTKNFTTVGKGNNRFEGSVSGLQAGTEIKIKVYKDDVLVDQIAKKVTK